MKAFKQFFTDDSGKYSSGRALMFIVTVIYLIIAVRVCIKTNTVPDFPLNVTMLVGGIYGLNKFSATKPFK